MVAQEQEIIAQRNERETTFNKHTLVDVYMAHSLHEKM